MTDKLQFKFSHSFGGVIWNIVSNPDKKVLLIEVRNHNRKRVSFAAIQYLDDKFLWNDFELEESWWVTLAEAKDDVVLFTLYLETQNPDKKGILAYGIQSRKLLWWHNDFSFNAINGNVVRGMLSKYGQQEVKLDLHSGEQLLSTEHEQEETVKDVITPVQFAAGTTHFTTVQTFLNQKLNLSPVAALEYLEFQSCIFVSYYLQENELANYLIVLNENGTVLLHEKLGEQLKGIGLDTFFVLSGCLFFVKNREELVSYFL